MLGPRGSTAVKNGDVHVPAFVPVALVFFVVVALLIWVLAAFLRGGYGWARLSLTVTLFFLAVGTVAGLRTGAPAMFMVLSVASFPLEAAAVVLLWHKDTSAYLRGTWAPDAQDAHPPSESLDAPRLRWVRVDRLSVGRCTLALFEHMFERSPREDTT